MGKGVIISNDGGGWYTVDVYYNQVRIENLLNRVEDKIVTILTETIPALQQDFDAAELAKDEAQTVIDELVTDLIFAELLLNIEDPETVGAWEAAVDAVKNGWRAFADPWREYTVALRALDDAKEKYELLLQEKFDLQDRLIESPQRMSLPCIDYADDTDCKAVGYPALAGTVGIRAIDSVTGGYLVIESSYPDGDKSRPYDAATHGWLQSTKAIGDWSLFFNSVVYPPYLKWLVKHRIPAKIIKIDKKENTAQILTLTTNAALDWLDPSIQPTIDTQDDLVSGVGFDYMSCGAAPFEVGDLVVYDSTPPSVIGFLEGPKPCHVATGGYLVNGSPLTRSSGEWGRDVYGNAAGNIVDEPFGGGCPGSIVSLMADPTDITTGTFATLGFIPAWSTAIYFGGEESWVLGLPNLARIVGVRRLSNARIVILSEEIISEYPSRLQFYEYESGNAIAIGVPIAKPTIVSLLALRHTALIDESGTKAFITYEDSRGELILGEVSANGSATLYSDGAEQINHVQTYKTVYDIDYTQIGPTPNKLGASLKTQDFVNETVSNANVYNNNGEIWKWEYSLKSRLKAEANYSKYSCPRGECVKLDDGKATRQVTVSRTIRDLPHYYREVFSQETASDFGIYEYSSNDVITSYQYYYISEKYTIYEETVMRIEESITEYDYNETSLEFSNVIKNTKTSISKFFYAFGELVAFWDNYSDVDVGVFVSPGDYPSQLVNDDWFRDTWVPATDPYTDVVVNDLSSYDDQYRVKHSFVIDTIPLEPRSIAEGRGGIIAQLPKVSYDASGNVQFDELDQVFYFTYLDKQEVADALGVDPSLVTAPFGVY